MKRSKTEAEGGARPLAVITGASSGIGLELARECVAHGHDVILFADEPAVHEAAAEMRAAGAWAQGHEVDLADYEWVELAYRAIERAGRPVDALLLNAGVGVGGEFVTETSLERELAMIQLNCSSVVHLAKRVIPGMVARKRGKVLITSSVVAVMPGTRTAVYGATKAFDLSFAEAIREELRGTGVTVTALQPNATATRFFRRADMEDMKVGRKKKDSASLVAKQGFAAMMRGDDKIYAGSITSRLMGVIAEFLPEPIKARQHGKLTERAT